MNKELIPYIWGASAFFSILTIFLWYKHHKLPVTHFPEKFKPRWTTSILIAILSVSIYEIFIGNASKSIIYVNIPIPVVWIICFFIHEYYKKNSWLRNNSNYEAGRQADIYRKDQLMRGDQD